MDDPPLNVEVRRSAGARRLSLRVSHIDGRALLTTPRHCSRRAAEAFVAEHRDWLRGALARAPDMVRLEPGAQTLYRGRLLTIAHATGRGVRLAEPDRLLVGGPISQCGTRVVAWFREEARAQLLARATVHAAALDRRFTKISIRDTRSRWGSCSSTGALSFSWRLILAPDGVLDYVAAHEVAHLVEMNHSARFWALVEQLRPDWRTQRDWLDRHVAELHRYRAD